MDWWMHLLTTYTCHLGLLVITVLLLISRVRRSPQHPANLFPTCFVFNRPFSSRSFQCLRYCLSNIPQLNSQQPATSLNCWQPTAAWMVSSLYNLEAYLTENTSSSCDFATGASQGQMVEKRWRKGQECNSGIRNWGLKLRLHLESSRNTHQDHQAGRRAEGGKANCGKWVSEHFKGVGPLWQSVDCTQSRNFRCWSMYNSWNFCLHQVEKKNDSTRSNNLIAGMSATCCWGVESGKLMHPAHLDVFQFVFTWATS